jgi:hypothetical protein
MGVHFIEQRAIGAFANVLQNPQLQFNSPPEIELLLVLLL